MNIQYFHEPFPYIIVDDMYTEKELNDLWLEMDYLNDDRRLTPSSIDKGAAWQEGDNGEKIELKFNFCQYLDEFFSEREFSTILDITEKLFVNDREIMTNHGHWHFGCENIDRHSTQLVYYENGNEYKGHRDHAVTTALTWFYRQPKKFTGGNLHFPDYDINVEILNNRVLIFPSVIQHAVTPVIMDEQYRGKKYGRYCISQFLRVS